MKRPRRVGLACRSNTFSRQSFGPSSPWVAIQLNFNLDIWYFRQFFLFWGFLKLAKLHKP